MKVKDLMNIFTVCDPDADIYFEFGGDDEYRKACAILIAEQPLDVDFRDDCSPMLRELEFARVDIGVKAKDVTITFEQGYLADSVIEQKIIDIAEQRRSLKKEGK